MAARLKIGKLVVIGVGLIGGSFALALKRARAVRRVVGVGRTRANLADALRLKVIDEARTIPRVRCATRISCCSRHRSARCLRS